jgi:glycosyltransferase involved in cell wall biosynthesis
MNSAQNPELSVVILCYGAGSSITPLVDRLVQLLEDREKSFELVLVANYKNVSDETPAVVAEIARKDSRIRYSARQKEGMFGWDMKTGFALATGKHIAVIDGDGQMPFEDIVRVYEALRAENADMAKTYRVSRADGRWRITVSSFYNALFRLLFPWSRVHDVNSKPKIFRRDAFEKLQLVSDDWFIDAEIMIQARRHKFRIVEIPTVFTKLKERRSFVRPTALFEFLKNLIVFRIKEFYV